MCSCSLACDRVRVMSGAPNLPLNALYDRDQPESLPDALTDMLGSFDLEAYGAQDAAELRNILDVVDPHIPFRGSGMVPETANQVPRLRSQSMPRPQAPQTRPNVLCAPEQMPQDTCAFTPGQHPFGAAGSEVEMRARLASELGAEPGRPQQLQSRDTKSVSPPGSSMGHRQYVSKADRVREKNRLAQARFRQKQRDEVLALERQVALTQERIDDKRRKCLHAQNSKQSIHSRLAKAADILLALEQCSGDLAGARDSPGDLIESLGNTAEPSSSRAHSAPVSMVASTNSTKTKTSAPAFSAPLGTTVVPLAGRFGCGKGRSRGRLVENYPHFAAISADTVSVDVEPFSFGSQVESFKSEAAATLGTHPRDVCWFIQQPFELPNGELLSISSCLGSYKCSLGMMLFFVANFLKATQFDRELRLYDEGIVEGVEDMDTSTSKPSRITSRSRTSSREVADDVDSLSLRKRSRADGGVGVPVTCSLVEKPLLDTRDPALASLTLRCGVNNQYLLEDAVRGVIGTILREHRGHMPRDAWLECCQVFLMFVDQLAGCSPDEERSAPAEELKGFAKACALLFQVLAETVVTVVSEDYEGSGGWEPSEHRRKQAWDLAERNIKSWGFTWCMLLMDAPRTAREMAVDFCGPSHRAFEHVEETHLKMYKSMRLETEQRCHLASLWREWQRRRRMLDRDHDEALGKLESLPAADDVNDSFILLVSALCSGNKSAVTTAATALDLPFDSILDENRTEHQFLGISPKATATGAEALRILREASERDNRVQTDVYSLWILPHMTTKQRLRFFATIVDTQVGALEILSVLQTAAFQQRRDELYSAQGVPRVDTSGHLL